MRVFAFSAKYIWTPNAFENHCAKKLIRLIKAPAEKKKPTNRLLQMFIIIKYTMFVHHPFKKKALKPINIKSTLIFSNQICFLWPTRKRMLIYKRKFLYSLSILFFPILQPHNLMRTHNCVSMYIHIVYIDTPYTNITGSIDINQDNFFARAVVLRKYCIVCMYTYSMDTFTGCVEKFCNVQWNWEFFVQGILEKLKLCYWFWMLKRCIYGRIFTADSVFVFAEKLNISLIIVMWSFSFYQPIFYT